MLRRQWFIAATAAVAGLLVPGMASAKNDLRAVYRIANGRRERVRMKDLKPGDIFEMEEVFGRCRATSAPSVNADGVWQIEAESGAGIH